MTAPRGIAEVDRVYRLAGWKRTVDRAFVTYTPPADATPEQIAATEAAATELRIRFGWLSP